MAALPAYKIKVYGNGDPLPAEAEEMFREELAYSRKLPPKGSEGDEAWRFALICAATGGRHVLGGVHLDMGPIKGSGPLAEERLAYLERSLVRPEYRRQGLATELLRRAIAFAAETDCQYIRCSSNWNNPGETALLRKCGFALVDIDGEDDEVPCYLAVRPLQGLSG